MEETLRPLLTEALALDPDHAVGALIVVRKRGAAADASLLLPLGVHQRVVYKPEEIPWILDYTTAARCKPSHSVKPPLRLLQLVLWLCTNCQCLIRPSPHPFVPLQMSDAAPLALKDLPSRSGDDPFMVYYTSGTTGTPKAVVLSHAVRRMRDFANTSFLLRPCARRVLLFER